jgi:hypothetical protein
MSALSVLYFILYDTRIIFPTGKWRTKLGVFQVPPTKKKKMQVLIFLKFEGVSESYTASLKGPVSTSGHSVSDFRRQSVTGAGCYLHTLSC